MGPQRRKIGVSVSDLQQLERDLTSLGDSATATRLLERDLAEDSSLPLVERADLAWACGRKELAETLYRGALAKGEAAALDFLLTTSEK